jgi:hypothetical protein
MCVGITLLVVSWRLVSTGEVRSIQVPTALQIAIRFDMYLSVRIGNIPVRPGRRAAGPGLPVCAVLAAQRRLQRLKSPVHLAVVSTSESACVDHTYTEKTAKRFVRHACRVPNTDDMC